MDTDAMLRRLRELAVVVADQKGEAGELAQLVQTLDKALMDGDGFFPKDWVDANRKAFRR